MFKTIAKAWTLPDLRKKMLFTLFIVFIFRVGSVIPVPFLDVHALKSLTEGLSSGESMLAYFDLFSGAIQTYVFCMLTMTYISNAIGDVEVTKKLSEDK